MAARYTIREDWLASTREDILEPDLPIIDAHHHLRLNAAGEYLFPEFLKDLRTGHNIIATVVVEGNSLYRASGPEGMKPVGETEYFNGVAAMAASGLFGPTQVAAGIVGCADLTRPEVEEVLHALVKAGGDRFRGVRMLTVWDASPEVKVFGRDVAPGIFRSREFRHGLGVLGRMGLSYDSISLHPQLGDVLELAREFPGTTFIVNHIGMPVRIGPYADKPDEVDAAWKKSISALAKCPNVYMKLGGLCVPFAGATYAREARAPTSEQLEKDWAPKLHYCIDVFGPGRCMFESNFPVDKTHYSYPVMWNAFKRIAKRFSKQEKAALFSETARKAYRLH